MLDDPELDEESESLLDPEPDDEDEEDELEEDPELESLDIIVREVYWASRGKIGSHDGHHAGRRHDAQYKPGAALN